MGPKVNCDLEGSITKNAIEPSPLFEDLRVPLIPCINREQGNQIDVCCRDPDYKDQQRQSKNNNKKNHNKKGKFNKNNGKTQGQTNHSNEKKQTNNGARHEQNVKPNKKT